MNLKHITSELFLNYKQIN